MLFQSSKLKDRMSLLPRFSEKIGCKWKRSDPLYKIKCIPDSDMLVCLFVCLLDSMNKTRKTILHLLWWERSKPPGSGHTRTEAQTTCVPKTAVQTTCVSGRGKPMNDLVDRDRELPANLTKLHKAKLHTDTHIHTFNKIDTICRFDLG